MDIINVGALRKSGSRFVKAFYREIDDALQSSEELAKQHVKQHSKFKRRSSTGSLKDATETKVVRLSSGRIVKVQSTKKTAKFLEYGTRPHRIRARRRAALRFVVGGKTLFRRSVMHPGTRPTKFLWNATHAAFRFAGNALHTAMDRAARRF